MVTDPIADLLVRIKNAGQRGHESVLVPASKLKMEILRVLKSEGFISDYAGVIEAGHPMIRVTLRYVEEGKPVIAGMSRVSKPGRRVFVGRGEIPRVMGGLGVAILTTSKGVMTDQESRRDGIGGEVLCHFW
ncbi:MAG: 30S ribosomal protein S8 [Nitrospirales bacterium]